MVSIVAVATPVAEGERAEFTLTRTGPTTEALTVQASWTYSDREEVQENPVLFQAGRSSQTPSSHRHDDQVVRDDLTLTVALQDGEGYAVSAAGRSAQVVLEDNDVAEFELTAEPAEIAEGTSATVQARITNGVTFEQDQTITLDFAGSTASKGADFTVSPESLTLQAGAGAATATLEAALDTDSEGDEVVTVAALHGGVSIGSATVTIAANDGRLSDDVTLSALTLSGIDIGRLRPRRRPTRRRWRRRVSSTTVTATANDAEASVTIADGAGSTAGGSREVSLSYGANAITATVTAADGQTTATYTVTVTREYTAPTASIAAGTAPVTEGAAAVFTVSLDKAGGGGADGDGDRVGDGRCAAGTASSVALAAGERSATLNLATANDSVVEANSTVTAALAAGDGYSVGAPDSASVVVEDDDAATFTVTAAQARMRKARARR